MQRQRFSSFAQKLPPQTEAEREEGQGKHVKLPLANGNENGNGNVVAVAGDGCNAMEAEGVARQVPLNVM